MMELKNLSYEDLLNLQRSVSCEIGRRNVFKKADVANVIWEKLYAPISKSFENKNLSKDVCDFTKPMSDVEKAIFKLCDIALENYRIKKRSNGEFYVQVNGGGSGILADKNDYQAMSDELSNVFLKYLEKETSDE